MSSIDDGDHVTHASRKPIRPARLAAKGLTFPRQGSRLIRAALTAFCSQDARVTCNMGGMTVRERVRAHRARMRAQGLRPIQIWVPDVRSPDFAAEAHRQSALVAAADRRSQDMDFVEAVSSDWDE